ncbi:hypothetical protein F5Y03DRAFT_66303 [Xylaria venustula]|nr:hypothetical protein F5Y03DRAFT_66303 [Xylaria venustula]
MLSDTQSMFIWLGTYFPFHSLACPTVTTSPVPLSDCLLGYCKSAVTSESACIMLYPPVVHNGSSSESDKRTTLDRPAGHRRVLIGVSGVWQLLNYFKRYGSSIYPTAARPKFALLMVGGKLIMPKPKKALGLRRGR